MPIFVFAENAEFAAKVCEDLRDNLPSYFMKWHNMEFADVEHRKTDRGIFFGELKNVAKVNASAEALYFQIVTDKIANKYDDSRPTVWNLTVDQSDVEKLNTKIVVQKIFEKFFVFTFVPSCLYTKGRFKSAAYHELANYYNNRDRNPYGDCPGGCSCQDC